jgi:hypothetical protein
MMLRCHLCPEAAQLLEATPAAAWYTAIDHALDQHRPELLDAPADTQQCFTVVSPGRPRILRPSTRSPR